MGSLVELFDSRSEVMSQSSKSSAELHYMAVDCEDESEVQTLLLNAIPVTYHGLSWQSSEIVERINNTTWRCVVRYIQPDQIREDEDPVIAFDTSGGQQHITQSIATIARHPATTPSLGGAIGFDGENVAGCDITVPVYSWQETHFLTDSQVDQNAYYALTGLVNNASFRGFEAGEVLFLGASGQKRGRGKWEVTFKFAASGNLTNLSVGEITGIAKKGWEYLWVQYGDAVDDTAKARIKKPVAVYVEQVYYSGPFSSLGIGTAPL